MAETAPDGEERGPLRRSVYAAIGLISVGLGFLGVVLPLVPTTPFVILAGACFVRSSPKLNRWLRSNPYLGPVLEQWETHRALPPRAKWVGIAALWVTFPVSIYFAPLLWVKVLLGALMLTATVILLRIPTRETDEATANPASLGS